MQLPLITPTCPRESARARVAGAGHGQPRCAAPDPVVGSKCLPHFMNAEPQEIDAKAQDDAHACSSQKGPWIDRPIILVVERSGFGVHAVPPWRRLTTCAQASRADSVNKYWRASRHRQPVVSALTNGSSSRRPSHSGQLERQLAQRLAGQLRDGVGERRRQRRQAGLAHAGGRLGAGHDVHRDLRHVGDARHRRSRRSCSARPRRPSA